MMSTRSGYIIDIPTSTSYPLDWQELTPLQQQYVHCEDEFAKAAGFLSSVIEQLVQHPLHRTVEALMSGFDAGMALLDMPVTAPWLHCAHFTPPVSSTSTFTEPHFCRRFGHGHSADGSPEAFQEQRPSGEAYETQLKT